MGENLQHCGEVTFHSSKFDVHWGSDTKRVYVSKQSNPELSFIHDTEFIAETAEEAPSAAIELLQMILGKESNPAST